MFTPVDVKKVVGLFFSKPTLGLNHRLDVVDQQGGQLGMDFDGLRQGNILPIPVLVGDNRLAIGAHAC